MSISNKIKRQEDFDIFDDDFEIIYEGDLPDICIDEDESGVSYPGQKSSYGERQPAAAKKTEKRKQKKGSRFKVSSLLSPIKKTAKTGGKAASKLVKSILRIATLLIILCIMALITVDFARNYSVYGTIKNIVSEKNYALGAYLTVAAVLLIFELITFIWALTSQRIREKHRNMRLDTGRGMFSFILMGAGSYLAGIFYQAIPETYPALTGAKGGLAVYGSLSGTLFVLCTAGIISCLLRRFLSS